MNPEDWAIYWRTVALTPFQIVELEAREMAQFMSDLPLTDWQTAKIDAAIDYWEMQMIGIRL